MTPQVAYANDLPVERGALITRLDAAGPGAAVGIEVGDIVVAIDGRPIRSVHDLHERLVRQRAGATVNVTVHRSGRTLVRPAVLGEER